ncbi:ADIPOR-like receptor SPBC12C2.09c [Pseudocercospora fuligena]|uniref:ADIPOR-like receptor SPBC12C2.09c n=1 Tax=Pseudocercospora fuligena TaxID=685502 RepID=A0A8H6VHP8_9PEZI|nr:ADIPOR-like receptor SPBC12C2.09c [Pseudocercospora fuligena]
MAGVAEEKTNASSADVHDAVQTAEKKVEKALTILWDQLPEWMQDNQFIHSGYRPPSNSYSKSAASIGSWHNETINIWTHLIGALLAGSAGVRLYFSIKPRFEMATTEDVMVFSCFFLGAVACLGMSATYHTISNHSHAVAKFGNRLDYIGIVFLIWGSFIPSIYYGFSAEPNLINLYWSMITTIGAGTMVVVLHPKFRSPSWRPFRAFMFVMMGLSAVFPVLHGLSIHGWAEVERRIALSWLITQGLLYIIGAMIYAARIPERWKPGTFDILGSSHQIFHALVVAAAAVHLVGLLKAFDHEHGVRTQSLYPGLRR